MIETPRDPGKMYPRHNDFELRTTEQVSKQLNISLEHVNRLVQQLVDVGDIRDKRVGGKGMHVLTTKEISLVQSEFAARYHGDPPTTNGGTTMTQTQPGSPVRRLETNEERLTRVCAEKFGKGSGRRYTIEEMAQAIGLTYSSTQSYVYRFLLPKRRDEPSDPDQRTPMPLYFYESDAKIFNAGRTMAPQPAKKEETPMNTKPATPVLSTPPQTLPTPQTKTPPATTSVAISPSQAFAEQVEPLDIALVDPRGLENAMKHARLFSYLFTRVGAIKVDGLEEIPLKIKLEPEIELDVETLGLRIEPSVTYWEVFMVTSAHPDTSECYQVVLTDRFHHIRVETDPNATK